MFLEYPSIRDYSLFTICGTLLFGLCSISLVFTWVNSFVYSFPAKPNTGSEPPLVPYCIPYLGHLVQFLRDPGDFLQKCR